MVIKKSKRAWTRIIEVFVALFLIMGIVVIILQSGNNEEAETSKAIHNVEISILRGIEYNQTLRESVLNAPKNEENGKFNLSDSIKNKIIEETPSNLGCSADICDFDDVYCGQDTSGKEIYTQEVFISSTIKKYNSRKLKLFCYKNY